MRCFYQRSDDDGETFTKPVEITAAFEPFRPEYDWKVLATGPAHGIQTDERPAGGARLAFDRHRRPRPPAVGHVHHLQRRRAARRGRRGEIAVPDTDRARSTRTRPSAVELADGRVMLNIRSESKAHRRLVATSKDGATGWSKPAFDDAAARADLHGAASSGSSATSRTADKNRLLFANPHNLDRADGKAQAGGKPRPQEPHGQAELRRGQDLAGEQDPRGRLQRATATWPSAPDGTIYCLYERRHGRRHEATHELQIPDAGPVQPGVADRREGPAGGEVTG